MIDFQNVFLQNSFRLYIFRRYIFNLRKYSITMLFYETISMYYFIIVGSRYQKYLSIESHPYVTHTNKETTQIKARASYERE